MFLKHILICLAFYIIGISGQTKLSPCQLQWKAYLAGEEFPDNSVRLDGDLFIAMASLRINFFQMGTFAGTADNNTKLATFNSVSRGKLTLSSYYLLTNPNDCAVSWVDAAFGQIEEIEYALPIGFNKYVAMRKSHGYVMAGTLVQADISHFYAINPEHGGTEKFLACEAIKSTENLKLHVGELTVLEPLEMQQPDFMGLDTIDNMSPVTLEHTVSHEKTVIIRHELTETRSFAQSTYTKVGFSFSIPGISFSLDVNWENRHDSAQGTLSNMINEKEETIKTLRTIVVPEYTKLQACSVLFTAKGQALPYEGVGTYNIPGRDANYVKNMLKQENYDESNIIKMNSTHVFVRIEGSFSIDTPMRSKLIVHEEGDEAGCNEIQRTINKLKGARVFHTGSSLEIQELENNLKKLLGD